MSPPLKKVLVITGKILLGSVVTILLLLVLGIFLLRLPSVQNYITHKVVSIVADKTHSRVEIKKIYIAFPKSVVIEGVFAEDAKHDTLISISSLKVDINMLGLLKQKVDVNSLYLGGANVNIKRSADSTFNFDFIVKAFASGKPKKPENKVMTDTIGWQIGVDKLALENVRGLYDDQLTGTSIRGKIGDLKLKMNGIDIRKLDFNANELFLANSSADIVISKSVKNSVDTIRSFLPAIALTKLTLKNIHFNFEQTSTGPKMAIVANSLVVFPERIDLNAQVIKVKSLQLDTASTAFTFKSDPNSTSSDNDIAAIASKEMGWHVDAGKLQLKQVDFKLDLNNLPVLTSGVDYNHLHMSNIALDIDSASYSLEQIRANIHHISLTERSGFVLKNLTAKATYDDQHAELDNLSLTTNKTQISKHLAIHYASIRTLGQNVGDMRIDADLRNTKVALDEIILFAPSLKGKPFFSGKPGRMVTVNGKVKGPLKDVTLTDLSVTGAGSTAISLSAHVTGLPDAANSVYDIHLKNLTTTKSDLQELVGDKLPSSINIPEKISLAGDMKGSFTDATAKINLQTSVGNLDADVSLRRLYGDTSYTANVNAKDFDVGYILKDSSFLGSVTGHIKLEGQNFSIPAMRANASAELESITLNSYNYNNIIFTASADQNTYKADVTIKDKNLVMDMNAALSLVKGQESVRATVNLEGAELYKLHLLNEDLKVSGKLDADLKGTIGDMNGQIGMGDVVLIKGSETYRIGSFAALSVNEKKHSAASIKSSIINGDYQGSIQLAALAKTLKNYVNGYFQIEDSTAAELKDTASQNFTLNLNILPHPVINGVLIPQLEKFNGADLKADFNSEKQKLDLTANVSGLAYKGTQLDNVHVEINSDEKAMNYFITLDRLKSGNFNLSETTLDGSLQNNTLDFALKVHDRDSANKLIVSGTLKQEHHKEYKLALDNDKLVFANQKWKMPEDNYVHFSSRGFYLHHVELNNGDQFLSIHSEKDIEEAPVKIEFKQFELGTFSQIVEKDTGLIRGSLNGTVELRNLQHTPAFVSDLQMSNVAYMQNLIGDIQVKADNLTADRYTAQVTISGADNDVKIKGYYAAAGSANQLNFKTEINKLQLHSVEGFAGGQLRQTSGYLTGNFDITGTGKQPVITGDMNFKDIAANVAYVNNYLSLKDEHVKIDGKGVYFHSFSVQDALGQKAVIDGNVYTSNFRQMNFNLSVKTDRFTVMNTTMADNQLFFGHVILNSDFTIGGDETLPVIRARAKLIGGSDFTVVVPSSKITVDRGEGVVVMTDTASNTGIMNNIDTIPIAVGFKGIDLAANVEVTRETSFKVIVDKSSGDSLVVRGAGQFSFSMDPDGGQSLTGTYVLSSGGYRASFQKLIKREFTIKDGSSITWNGTPTDATVDLTASYAVRSSPADLLSADLGGTTTAERNVYRKLLNFEVLMNMKGKLLKPDISFQLDMADQDKDAFGGTVYAKINSLNNDPGELNKQVFALLVIGSFVPTGSGGGEGVTGAATTLARNSVNQILTDQLNNLSGRYIKGVDLNFGIQSNDEYDAAGGVAQKTEFSVGIKKEFFKSRLSIQVGTSINVNNSNGSVTQNGGGTIGGDFALEYKITADGRYRFKAFRQNQYESLIDGLLYKTGIGFVFTKDYDRAKDLFARPEKKVITSKPNETP